jgi:hypothetical protein
MALYVSDMALCVSEDVSVYDCDVDGCDCEVVMTPDDACIARDFADGVQCACH